MITITICNWQRFNGRKDVSRPSWFRVENNLWFDEQFDEFAGMEILVWLFLLASASRKNSATFPFNPTYIARHARVPSETVRSAVEKLSVLGCVRLSSSKSESALRGRNVDVTPEQLPAYVAGDSTYRYGEDGEDGDNGVNGYDGEGGLSAPLELCGEDEYWQWANDQAAETLGEIEPLEEQLPLELEDGPQTAVVELSAPGEISAGESAYELTADGLAAFWSDHCGDQCASCRDLTEARRRKAKKQIKKYPDPGHWREALERFSEHTVPNWRPGFDDFLDEEKRTRALEGKYAGRRSDSRGQGTINRLRDQARRVQEGSL